MRKTETRNLTPNLLIDQLRHEDLRKRLVATSHLNELVAFIGPDKTRCTLLPYLNEFEDDEEEILVVLLDKVECLRKSLSTEHELDLVPLLEKMCRKDSDKVASKATALLVQVLQGHELTQGLQDQLASIIRALSKVENQHARKSALVLLCRFWGKLASSDWPVELVKEIAGADFGKLRKPAAQQMQNLLGQCPASCQPKLLEVFESLLKDREELIRVELIRALPAYLKLKKEDSSPLFESLFSEQSWRIKLALLQVVWAVLPSLTPAVRVLFLDKVYLPALADSDGLVHCYAAEALPRYWDLMPADTQRGSVSKAISRLEDSDGDGRISLCRLLIGMSSFLGKDEFGETCVPALLKLIDRGESAMQVQILKEVNRLEQAADFLLPVLGKALDSLVLSKSWRCRIDTLSQVVVLCQSSQAERLKAEVGRILEAFLFDLTARVREQACRTLTLVFQVAPTLLSQHFLASVVGRKDNKNYHWRLTVVQCCLRLLGLVKEGPDRLLKEALRGLAGDKVGLVRGAVAAGHTLLQEHGLGELVDRLKGDEDAYVRQKLKG